MERPQPPKAPRTGTGAEIVESILAAAEWVIDREGLARFTTNRVAERAGVSVGSLYQYFPNKEAVLAELARRLERRTRAQLLDILTSSSGLPLAATAARVVDAMLDGIGGLAFRRALLEEVPSAWKVEVSSEVDAELRERLRDVLAERSDVRRGDHALMAWVIAHAVEGIVEVTVRTAPDLVARPEFRTELLELACRYLAAAAPEREPAPGDDA
jgi:AcrR family transcriptional regulator